MKLPKGHMTQAQIAAALNMDESKVGRLLRGALGKFTKPELNRLLHAIVEMKEIQRRMFTVFVEEPCDGA